MFKLKERLLVADPTEALEAGQDSSHAHSRSIRMRLKKIALLSLGWAFIVLGIAGLFLPVIQGVLFLLIGLLILSSKYAWAHQILGKIRTRFPAAAQRFEHASNRATVRLRYLFRV